MNSDDGGVNLLRQSSFRTGAQCYKFLDLEELVVDKNKDLEFSDLDDSNEDEDEDSSG